MNSRNLTNILLMLLIAVVISYGYNNFCNQKERFERFEKELDGFASKADSAKISKITIEKVENKIDKLEKDLRNDYDNLLNFGLPAALLALLALYYGVYQAAYKLAIDQAKSDIAKTYRPEEEILRENEKILVVLNDTQQQIDIQAIMQNLKFQNVEYILESEASKDDFKQVKEKKPNSVFLYQTNSSRAQLYADNLLGFGIFFYNTEHSALLNNINDKISINSSKFAAQIYPNLINLLKFNRKS